MRFSTIMSERGMKGFLKGIGSCQPVSSAGIGDVCYILDTQYQSCMHVGIVAISM